MYFLGEMELPVISEASLLQDYISAEAVVWIEAVQHAHAPAPESGLDPGRGQVPSRGAPAPESILDFGRGEVPRRVTERRQQAPHTKVVLARQPSRDLVELHEIRVCILESPFGARKRRKHVLLSKDGISDQPEHDVHVLGLSPAV